MNATGTRIKADWRNPHIQLIVEVKKDGQTETWSFEGPPPVFFKERDISKADFEGAFGKTVTVEASRARDGPLCRLMGRVWPWCGAIQSPTVWTSGR